MTLKKLSEQDLKQKIVDGVRVMTAGLDDCGYVLVYEIGGEQHIETFYTKQEMEQFIEGNNVRPLFQYEEKTEREL